MKLDLSQRVKRYGPSPTHCSFQSGVLAKAVLSPDAQRSPKMCLASDGIPSYGLELPRIDCVFQTATNVCGSTTRISVMLASSPRAVWGKSGSLKTVNPN